MSAAEATLLLKCRCCFHSLHTFFFLWAFSVMWLECSSLQKYISFAVLLKSSKMLSYRKLLKMSQSFLILRYFFLKMYYPWNFIKFLVCLLNLFCLVFAFLAMLPCLILTQLLKRRLMWHTTIYMHFILPKS